MFQFGAYQMTMMGQTVNVGMFQMPKDFPDKLGRFIGELFCREWVKPDFLTEYSEMLSASQGIHWRRRVMSAVFYAIKERSAREGGREGQSVEDWMKELEYDYMEHLEEQSIARSAARAFPQRAREGQGLAEPHQVQKHHARAHQRGVIESSVGHDASRARASSEGFGGGGESW